MSKIKLAYRKNYYKKKAFQRLSSQFYSYYPSPQMVIEVICTKSEQTAIPLN